MLFVCDSEKCLVLCVCLFLFNRLWRGLLGILECFVFQSRKHKRLIGLSSLSDETSGLAEQEAVRADLSVVDHEHVGSEVLLVLDSLGSTTGEGTRLGLLRNFGSLLSDFASIGETTVGTSHARNERSGNFGTVTYTLED